ncbi:MAG: ATP-dependent DNA helicase [Nanoarchaeota archaeon]
MLFPYSTVRPTQNQMMQAVEEAFANKKCAILDAPTGIGKTAGALAPAISQALDNGLTVFFLTSRHTQHRLVIETVKLIEQKHGKKVVVADMIAKRYMCAQDGAEAFKPREFLEYCKRLRESNQCEFYENFGSINKPSVRTQQMIKFLENSKPLHVEELVETSKKQKLCPYEIAGMLGSKADLIVCDYAMLFHPQMRESILKRTKKELEKCLVIIDEAHNLSSRLRDLMSHQTSTVSISRAQKEAAKILDDELVDSLNEILNELEELSDSFDSERLISKNELFDLTDDELEDLTSRLQKGAAIIHEAQQHSFLAGIAEFLAAWRQEEDGYARIISKYKFRNENIINVRLRCLDPSIWTKQVVDSAHSTIMMSGTLHPTFMHKDVLGFPTDTIEQSYPSPFPQKNRLCLIVPEVSTKFARRSRNEYERIAKICASITNNVPGNAAIYFPSYQLRNDIHAYFHPLSKKRFFLEMQDFTKKDKASFLEEFKSSYPDGVLLGVTGGNFSEGVDIEGNKLKAVLVVGLPLEHPDLETKSLIKLYDKKFGRGWDYGYLLPAFNRTVQAAGRCIRSETDRGVIALLDERYAWPQYKPNLPSYWNAKVTRNYEDEVKKFFNN